MNHFFLLPKQEPQQCAHFMEDLLHIVKWAEPINPFLVSKYVIEERERERKRKSGEEDEQFDLLLERLKPVLKTF